MGEAQASRCSPREVAMAWKSGCVGTQAQPASVPWGFGEKRLISQQVARILSSLFTA